MRSAIFITLFGLGLSATAVGQTSDNPQDYMTVDGVSYFKTDKDKKEVCVHWQSGHKPYSGDVIVPETVTYREEVWRVTGVGESCFFGSGELTSVKLPSSVTKIDEYAFYGCPKLTDFDFPPMLAFIGESAFGGSSFTKVRIPETVTAMGNAVFENSEKLREATLPSSLTTAPDYLFSGCGALERVDMPSTVAVIGGRAFNECLSLKNVEFPAGLTTIGTMAFHSCTSLESISLPSTVTEIGDGAFAMCDAVRSVTSSATEPPAIGGQTFADLYDVTLYVPEGCRGSYRAASYWSQFSVIEELLPDVPANNLDIYIFDETLAAGEETFLELAATYESSDPSVAVVDMTGIVRAVAAGTCRITVRCGSAEGYVDLEVSGVSAVTDAEGRTFTVSVVNGHVLVGGVPEGHTAGIFDLNGMKIAEQCSSGRDLRFSVPSGKVYVVSLPGGKTAKVTVR